MSEPIGNLLDSLGVQHCPTDGELVSAAVVLLKVIDDDGRVSMRMAWSDGMSWIERLGMLAAATATETPGEGDAE